MLSSKSILLTVAVSIAFSTAALAGDASETGRATMLSPITIYPSDNHAADKNLGAGLRTGRSSSRAPLAVETKSKPAG